MNTLPHGWTWAPLSTLAENLDSQRIPVNAAERAKRIGDVPYYGATGQVGTIDSALFDEELVLLGEDGAPFLDSSKPKAYLIDGPAWVNNHAHVLRGRVVTNRYLLHYLNHFNYHGYANGTTRLKLTQGQMNRIPIPVAPRAEQERIVAAIEEQFSRLDSGATAIQDAERNLSHFTEAAFQSVIDEDSPFVALDSLTEQPNGIVDGPFGSNLKTEHYREAGPRVIRLQNIGNGEFVDAQAHISTEHYERLSRHSVRTGDLVCALLGEVLPRAIIVPAGVEPAIVKADCPRIRLSPNVNATYVWAVLNAPSTRNAVSTKVKGVGRPRLTLRELRQVAIPLPSRDEQDDRATKLLSQLDGGKRLTAQLESAHVQIDALRRAILATAFSGQLVPQDASDEAASLLLERIAIEQSDGHMPIRTRKTRTTGKKAS